MRTKWNSKLNKEILVVPVSDETEFKVVKNQGFYRLPAEKGYTNPSEYAYLAVYRGVPDKRVDHVAHIKKVRIVKGKELNFGKYKRQFTNYTKGEYNYDRNFYRIEIGPLIRLGKPV